MSTATCSSTDGSVDGGGGGGGALSRVGVVSFSFDDAFGIGLRTCFLLVVLVDDGRTFFPVVSKGIIRGGGGGGGGRGGLSQ